MIKISHTHENGKVCYMVRSSRKLTDMGILDVKGKKVAYGYQPYSAMYYLYNPETGSEIGSMRKELFEMFEGLKRESLVEDSTCKL